MGCSCGQSARTRQAIQTRNSGSAGSYPLFAYQGCTSLYTGRWEGFSIYVVARETAEERMFAKNQLVEASVYAREVKAQIENLPTAGLCHEAVVAIYG